MTYFQSLVDYEAGDSDEEDDESSDSSSTSAKKRQRLAYWCKALE